METVNSSAKAATHASLNLSNQLNLNSSHQRQHCKHHHLACLSGLSQAPLLSSNGDANGSERSTPVSLQSHGSPNKFLQLQPPPPPLPKTNSNNLKLNHISSTPLPSSAKSLVGNGTNSSSIFFPPLNASHQTQQYHSQSHHQLPHHHHQQSLHSPKLMPQAATSSRMVDINMNAEHEFNREASKRISPSSMSASQSFPGFFPPPHPVQKPQPQPPSSSSSFRPSSSTPDQWAQQDENYHIYHEPMEPDEPPSPPPPKPMSSSFAHRASHHGRPNDVSADIYTCYVTLRNNERSNNRSRSYHGPKNTSSQNTVNSNACKSQQSPLAINEANKNNLTSTSSVADLQVSPTNLAAHPSMLPIQFRDHCVRELIETESNYVHALEMIITCFAKPLENLLRRDDRELIFGHIKHFYNIHTSFQADLVKAALKWFNKDFSTLSPQDPSRNNSTEPTRTSQFSQSNGNNGNSSPLSSPAQHLTLSACFLNVKEKFLKYGEYCASLSKAQELLDDLTSKNEAIAVQLDHCQQDANEGKFKLRDLLSLPMQRILKYHLLLAQLIKNTSPNNSDYHGLKRAHETMVDLGQYINEVKRDTEAMQIINELEQSITGMNMPPNTQLSDYGRLIADDHLRIKSSSELGNGKSSKTLNHDTKPKQRYIFLFDKVLLACKSGVRGIFQYKEAIVLSEYELEANPTSAQNEISAKFTTKDKWGYQFNLVKSSDRSVHYCLYTKTLESKNRWIIFLQRAFDNIRPAACRNSETNHEFLMHTFDKASSCDHCGKLLLGLYYQGYRCRNCFTSAHKKCLASIRPCGPVMPPKNNVKMPPSPSVRSNCSDDSRNTFLNYPTNSSSTPCVDVVSKNEYSNIKGRGDVAINATSSFRENCQRNSNILSSQRSVSSMTNVSSGHKHQGQSEAINSYVNFLLNDQPWFCGRMERDRAQTLLETMTNGTFLVRVSPKHNGSHVISLNYNNQVKHMRIYVSKDNQLYLSQNRYFKGIIELVSWYERNSLVESFHMLDAKLLLPYKTACQQQQRQQP